MFVLVIGCGRVGAQLATNLGEQGHNVVVVDRNPEAFHRLSADFNGATVVGNGFDEDVLREAGIEQADAFVAVTDLDNANIMAGQVAKKLFDVPKVIARVYYPDREKTYHRLGLDTICGTKLVAEKILNWATNRSSVTEIALSPDMVIVEMKANSSVAEKTIGEIEVPGEFRPFIIYRNGRSIVVSSDMTVEEDDTIMATTRPNSVAKINKLYDGELSVRTISGKTGSSCGA